MALLGKFDESYTRTGNSFFTKLANWSSLLPIPVVNSALTGFFGFIGTAWETAEQLLRGKPLSAATALAGGIASTSVNAISGAFWWVNLGSGVATGRSAGTHARKLTEEVIGGITGALGQKPVVLRSYQAGIGYMGNGMMQAGRGQFTSMVAQQRGQDPQAYYNSKMNGEMAQHVAELDSARGQQSYQGIA